MKKDRFTRTKTEEFPEPLGKFVSYLKNTAGVFRVEVNYSPNGKVAHYDGSERGITIKNIRRRDIPSETLSLDAYLLGNHAKIRITTKRGNMDEIEERVRRYK